MFQSISTSANQPINMIQVHKDLNRLPQIKNAVVTIGTFDGVHVGHQQIINLLKEEAAAVNGETIIITFHPHPRSIIQPGKNEVKVLNTLEEKAALLDSKGIQHLAVTAFNEAFANQSAEEYIEHFLVKKFHPHTIIIGYDHKFGKGRLGDYRLLEDLAQRFNYRVKEIPEHVLNHVTVSSTKIRHALLHHNVQVANNFLGYEYFFEGKIVEGKKLGRTIGYPTANIVVEHEEKLIPANGVYAVRVKLAADDSQLQGMMNIGTRPTVDGEHRTIEVHIFDFNEDIYNRRMSVYIHSWLREEIKFEGIDKLKEQLAKDEAAVRQALLKSCPNHYSLNRLYLPT